jgi:hypothetical protein
MMFAELLFVVDIPGFDDYSISECGIVYCWRSKNFISVFVSDDGYKMVHLYDDIGKDFKKRIHILLAEAYIHNTNNLPIVDHINRNILDNSLSNLRWCNYIQSSQNTSKRKSKTSSRYRGVCLYKKQDSKNDEIFQGTLRLDRQARKFRVSRSLACPPHAADTI